MNGKHSSRLGEPTKIRWVLLAVLIGTNLPFPLCAQFRHPAVMQQGEESIQLNAGPALDAFQSESAQVVRSLEQLAINETALQRLQPFNNRQPGNMEILLHAHLQHKRAEILLQLRRSSRKIRDQLHSENMRMASLVAAANYQMPDQHQVRIIETTLHRIQNHIQIAGPDFGKLLIRQEQSRQETAGELRAAIGDYRAALDAFIAQTNHLIAMAEARLREIRDLARLNQQRLQQ